MKRKQYTLPPILELSGMMEETQGRTILLHVRSLTCVEIFSKGDIELAEGVISREFTFINSLGLPEVAIMAVHFCEGDAHPDFDQCQPYLNELAEYYINYTYFEDRLIYEEETKIKWN